MTYRITDKKARPLLSLNQNPTPSTEAEVPESPSSIREVKPESDPRLSCHTELRILVDIRMSNGVHLSQKNLSYEGLKSLVEKLEGLC